jgi:hypothetical protein
MLVDALQKAADCKNKIAELLMISAIIYIQHMWLCWAEFESIIHLWMKPVHNIDVMRSHVQIELSELLAYLASNERTFSAWLEFDNLECYHVRPLKAVSTPWLRWSSITVRLFTFLLSFFDAYNVSLSTLLFIRLWSDECILKLHLSALEKKMFSDEFLHAVSKWIAFTQVSIFFFSSFQHRKKCLKRFSWKC